MLTTVPFTSAPGLDRPVSEIMHHGFIAVPAPPRWATLQTVFISTGASHVLVRAADARIGVIADSDLVAQMAP